MSARERGRVLEVHIPECVAVAEALAPSPGSSWLDLGTGGGLPGLVGAVVAPAVGWTLVDARRKKTAAVEGFARELGLDNVTVVTGRAEELAHVPAHRERYDGVVSRAVATLPVLAELARGFCAPHGVIAAVKGPSWPDEVDWLGPALRRLRLATPSVQALSAPERPTVLVTMRPTGPAPTRYPRAVGVPASKPLGR